MMTPNRIAIILYSLAFCAVLNGPVLMAQALPTATGPAATLQIGVAVSAYHIDYGQRWLGGTQAWIDYKPLLHLGIEGEARSLRYHEDLGVHASTYLIGPCFSLRRGALDPFVKVLVGTGRFSFPYSYAHGTYFVAEAGAGVDVQVGKRLNLRLIDVAYQQWPKFNFGDMTSYGASAGLSFNLRRGETWKSE